MWWKLTQSGHLSGPVKGHFTRYSLSIRMTHSFLCVSETNYRATILVCSPRTYSSCCSSCHSQIGQEVLYRGPSLIRNDHPLGPYLWPMPRILVGSSGGGRFLVGEVPLYQVYQAQDTGRAQTSEAVWRISTISSS